MAENYLKRLLVERTELEEKIEKLNDFIFSGKADMVKVSNEEKNDLLFQIHHMKMYKNVLDNRIRRGQNE